ncbi:homoserine O-succinyltransferase [Austwickia chelonae]|uniref:Homoserine O-acetyltransferase n=1 Tax=Austwickia chelonae NBRC 105200 TaxID=1184607 RepID=K6V9B6_9MICO|nr:homoserine O-succinyltransferase [Austwickia chelonae]GAB78833.1 homoserine O-succinyltransferase [Austwickia chelonae NBRC 105200]SEV85017.1 homoserine O-succinyltransferase [Austwickia chelonae]
MPVTIPRDLPARATLEAENVFTMSTDRADHQDIRPLHIAMVNLMPTKVDTETQVLRLLANSPLQIHFTLLRMRSHESKNTPVEHLETFYTTFDQVRGRKFDGLIITGAPVELMAFEEVSYWDELVDIMEWSRDNVFSTLHTCWGAQAGLYHHFGVPKHELTAKIFGIFDHQVLRRHAPIVRGFDEIFPAPHSRHTGIAREDVLAHDGLDLVAESDEAGVYLVTSRDQRQLFVTGHPEYDRRTLAAEYERDVARGLPIDVPAHYFPGDDPQATPMVTWRSHAYLLYSNWLNFYVYQRTPYDLTSLTPVPPADGETVD